MDSRWPIFSDARNQHSARGPEAGPTLSAALVAATATLPTPHCTVPAQATIPSSSTLPFTVPAQATTPLSSRVADITDA